MIFPKEVSVWIIILLSNSVDPSGAIRGCITILKEPNTKSCICTKQETGFTKIPDKFPDFVAELTIEYQNIDYIDSSQLRNLPNLVNLTLNNNRMSRVDSNSFAYVPQLLSLKLSTNSLMLKDSSFPSKALIYLKSLKILDLSKNPLGFLPDYYFQSLKQLNVLNLSGAQRGFFIEENGFYGLSNLQLLDLSFTNLKTLSDALAHSLSTMQLQEFYLYNNPWHCDCNLQWLKMWFTKYKSVKFSKDQRKEPHTINSGDMLPDLQPQCVTPLNVRGKNLLSISGDAGSIGIMDFKCPPLIYTKDRNVDINRGQNLTLTCDLHANPGGNVAWSKNGMVVQKHWPRITWSTSQGIKFKAWLSMIEVEESDSGNWRCILTTNVGKVSATFFVKVLSITSQFDYKYILKYVGIGAVTIILLLVVIGIIIYCIYGFQIQNNQHQKSSPHEKVVPKNDVNDNYRIISRPKESIPLHDHQHFHSTPIGPQCNESTHSPFSHYLINGTHSVCLLHGDANKTPENNDKMDNSLSFADCSLSHGHNTPCPIHGDVLSYLSTTKSTTTFTRPDLYSTVHSKSPGEFIARASPSKPVSIITSPMQGDSKFLSSVHVSSSFSFSTAI